MMRRWFRWLAGGAVAERGPRRGALWIVSAPSGAGKTSLVKELCRRRPNLKMSCSYTTRPQRPQEVDGRDYHFVDRDRFDELVAGGHFLEHAEVFGNCYATGQPDVEALMVAGNDVVLEIDWQGARQARGRMPEARSVFILPPSRQELERRLRGRRSDSEQVISRRLAEADVDMSHWSEFDYVVINDDFDAAAARIEAILDGAGEGHRTEAPGVAEQIRAVLA